MPAAFQKVMGYTLVRLDNTNCFLDDIIIVIRGSKEDHLKLFYKCLKKIYDDNLKTKLPKCYFAKTEKNGYAINFLNLELHHLKLKQGNFKLNST